MSYMKRLLETLEPVPQDSLMYDLLHNACPEVENESFFPNFEYKIYRISLHCADFLVECWYDPETSDYLILNYEKELT